MEELRGGAPSSPQVFNLDSVIVRSASPFEVDESYSVHQLQSASVIQCVKRAGIDGLDMESMPEGRICITARNAMDAGRAAQTAVLKAFSMGLAARICPGDSPEKVEVTILKRK